MTGLLDTRARATAETMIAKFGKAMTLRREVVGTYDAAQGTAPVVPTDYDVVGVVTQPSTAMLSAGLAQSGDLAVMLAAKATEVTADYPIVGVVAQPSPAMFQAGLAVAGDITVLIAAKATSLVPVPGDELIIDGATWQATSVRSMFSGELIATYEVMARG